MSEELNQRVVIYFDPKNVYVKDFAGKIRNSKAGGIPILTTLIWGNQFKDEANVLGAHAIVIQHDLLNRDFIAKHYRAFMPDCEIHYMDAKGEWYAPPEQSAAVGSEKPPFPSAPVAGVGTDAAPATVPAK